MIRRFASLFGLALLLAGCASISDGSDFRPPASEAEWREWRQYEPMMNRITSRLISANAGHCGERCSFGVVYGPASGIGAFYTVKTSPPQIWLTMPLVRFLENEDETALVVAHEWAHILAGHAYLEATVPARSREFQADCIGAVLAARAGYDVGRAAESMRRMARTGVGFLHTLSGGGTHPTFAERHDITIRAGSQSFAAWPELARYCGLTR